MEKAYEPNLYEDKIYQDWEKSGFFAPEAHPPWVDNPDDPKRPHFSIVLPPPNVTGTLHIGHAAMLAIQDSMARYHRMKGDKTLWLPGTDHAAIATQTKVEKLLMQKGIKDPKKELGREKFLAEVNKFAQESHDTIINQCKKMGSSLDWSREAFTLDEPRNLAVRTVFKKMYDDGLIYRGYRIVNWCPRCHSTLADDEVEYKEQKAKLYTFKYSHDFPFAIATTRPETKLGDTAVAVNPKDNRYKKYIGKTFVVKSFAGGPDLNIKVIGDESVDMNFGTGALGVTPAHSHVDYEMAREYKLEIIKIIDEDGKMTEKAGKEYAGLDVLEAREKVIRNLLENGSIDKDVTMPSFQNNLSVCYRCGTAVEPLPSKQWFIDVNKKIKVKAKKLKDVKDGGKYSLKELMQKAVKSKQIKIIPNRFEKTYFHWIDNLRDWCISRQIWYGHQIPVWYKKAKKGVKITFVRHGETEAHVAGISPGHLSTPLTAAGKKTTSSLRGEINEDFDVIISSDLDRAVETVRIIFGDKEFKTDKRLREIDYGDLSGSPTAEINKDRMRTFPNGESYRDVKNRVTLFLADLMEEYDGKHVVIVAHSGVRKVLDVILCDQELNEQHLASPTVFDPIEYELNNLSFVGVEAPKGAGWTQDPDTLDTWFSSGLWTFSTLGYPNLEAEDLKNYHPTTVMETGYDILFFWVARMILMTTYALGEIPFETVYLHGLVRDEQGRKMSKSLGNVIDPLDTIKKYGADATRLSLLIGNTPGNDLKLNEEKVAGFRNFANKLWNIARFVTSVIPTETREAGRVEGSLSEPRKGISRLPSVARNDNQYTLSDKWILSRLNETIKTVTENIEKFNFSYAGEVLRDFTWGELADWYLEISKIESASSADKGNKSEILNYILETILKLWHPFMPFVTETIWRECKMQNAKCKMLMISEWPSRVSLFPRGSTLPKRGEGVAEDFELLRGIITSIRSLRADYKIDPVKKLKVVISAGEKQKLIEENAAVIKGLGRLEDCKIERLPVKPDGSVGFVVGGVEVFVDLSSVVDLEKEKARLKSEIENLEKYLKGLEMKLGNESFVKNALKEVVEKEKTKMGETKEKLEKLNSQLKSL